MLCPCSVTIAIVIELYEPPEWCTRHSGTLQHLNPLVMHLSACDWLLCCQMSHLGC